ncbi:MAG: GspE/PulE family protein [Candidatus Omnitrophota bacterium]|nr:GspE/PulE family protein [Candidatus Omnitrophota bacterium]
MNANINLLISKGIITQEQVTQAQKEANRLGMPLEKALEHLGFISEADILKTWADFIGVPFMDLTDYLIDPEVIKLIPEELARKFKALPLFKIGNSLTIAIVDPQDIVALDEIRKKSNMAVIEPVLASQGAIAGVIDQYYGAVGDVKRITEDLTEEKLIAQAKGVKDLADIAEEPPVIKLVNLIIVQAVRERSSDIHIEPSLDKVLIRFRIDGILYEAQILPKHLQSAFASRIKVMAGMDIAEIRKPQDGRIQMRIENRNLDLRVSSFPTVYGENIVLRILDKSNVLLGLVELGFSKTDLKNFEKLIRRPNGIILVTGPTGSGKTTTLYAALSCINSMEKNIITIEDPVEYEIPLIRQTQVNPLAGITFATGLRSILRQDPDIVMVGEIRDKETAEIAISASLTGHLVFSTLHTNDAASSLTRLLDMGIEPFLIATSVIGVLSQRLVRLICPKCKERYAPSVDMLADLKMSREIEFYRGRGCTNCKNTGYLGRSGIFEFLVINEEIKSMIIAKASGYEIQKKAVELGMRTLYEDALEKIRTGAATIDEVLRVTEEV